MGVSGSGKTVVGTLLARALGAEFVEGDTYHPPANIEKMSAGIPLTDHDRAGWLRAIGERIKRANEKGEILIVSCSALKRSYRDTIRADAGAVQFVFLRGDRKLIATRIRERKGHFMPPSLLDSQFSALEEPSTEEDVWVVDIKDAPEVIAASLIARASA